MLPGMHIGTNTGSSRSNVTLHSTHIRSVFLLSLRLYSKHKGTDDNHERDVCACQKYYYHSSQTGQTLSLSVLCLLPLPLLSLSLSLALQLFLLESFLLLLWFTWPAPASFRTKSSVLSANLLFKTTMLEYNVYCNNGNNQNNGNNKNNSTQLKRCKFCQFFFFFVVVSFYLIRFVIRRKN